jgi:DNA-binding transcriptional LysR family regulator
MIVSADRSGGMRASLRAIEIFVRAVEGGSFVAAARSLLIDPAVVSRAIKTLEENLGILLFTRSTRVLKLTTGGARFYRDGVEILQRVEEAVQRSRADAALHGQLKIGMGPALTRRMLLRVIPSFQQLYPEVRLVLVSINDAAEIGDEGIDILIRPRSLRRRGGQHRERQGVVVRKLLQSPAILCASPEYLQRVGSPQTPADLARYACVALLTLERDVQDEWRFSNLHARAKIKFVPKLIVHGDGLREAAVAGCGIIRLRACHVDDEIRSGVLVRVLPDWDCLGGPPIVAIYRKARPTLSRVNAFVRHLAEAFKRYNSIASVETQTPPSRVAGYAIDRRDLV